MWKRGWNPPLLRATVAGWSHLASWKSVKKDRGRRERKRMQCKETGGGKRHEREEEQEEEIDVDMNEFRCRRLKCSFVQQFVDAIADLPQRQSVLLSVPIQLGQIVAVGKMVENVIDARV